MSSLSLTDQYNHISFGVLSNDGVTDVFDNLMFFYVDNIYN